MWERIVADPRYRCLIPVTAFGEPDGRPGSMTRTWFGVKDAPIFAWAGFCKNTPDWGPVFAGMTTDSNAAVAPLNPRMPVLLQPDEYDRWLHGQVADVIAFQYRPFPPERLTKRATDDLWVRRERAVPRQEQTAFL
jgi:putative SOS response-associated peptidase YedK